MQGSGGRKTQRRPSPRLFQFRAVAFGDMQRALERLFASGAQVILYESGIECGRRSYQRHMKGKVHAKAVTSALRRLKLMERWGKFKIDLEKGVILVKDSFEADGYGGSDVPVCHFMRGYLTGFFTEYLKKEVKIVEEQCEAQGKPYCLFRIVEKKPE
ncbi:MAG: hypothetical protein AYL30_005460 [Candidatus Hecatellales archaeon B24]|nr:MAG: hypothetical protein AYL30_005460 [Candidatus Hecatellales archaeon B24]